MKKQRIGTTISTNLNKTITVSVQTRYSHPRYRKIVTKTKKYMAHDEGNRASLGDIVLLEECRPLSKKKNWILKKIITLSNSNL